MDGLEQQNYLRDNELFFLDHLSRNEAQLEYFHCLQEGLCSLFL